MHILNNFDILSKVSKSKSEKKNLEIKISVCTPTGHVRALQK